MSLGRCDDPFADRSVDRIDREQVRHEGSGLRCRERLEVDRRGVQLAAAPRRSRVEELWPRHAREQQRRLDDPVGEVLDEIEHRGLCPLHVVDHERDWLPASEPFEESADRPQRLLARFTALQPEELRELAADALGVLVVGDGFDDLREGLVRGLHAVQAGGLLDGLDHWPEGDAVAVRQASSAERRHPFRQALGEGREQTRLPDAADPEDREQLARAVRDRPIERIAEQSELALASHHRRIEATREAGGSRIHLEDAVRRDRFADTLQPQWLHGFGEDRVAHEPEGLLRDQDLVRPGGLLEPRREVRRHPRHERLGGRRIADHDLAGRDARPRADPDAVLTLELVVQPCERVGDLRGRADGTDRVVLVDPRDAEDRHHGVPDELLDRAAVPLEEAAHRVVVTSEDPPEQLRVEAATELGRPRDVGEQDGHGAPVTPRGRRGLERCTASVTEARPFAVLAPADRTDRHAPKRSPGTTAGSS